MVSGGSLPWLCRDGTSQQRMGTSVSTAGASQAARLLTGLVQPRAHWASTRCQHPGWTSLVSICPVLTCTSLVGIYLVLSSRLNQPHEHLSSEHPHEPVQPRAQCQADAHWGRSSPELGAGWMLAGRMLTG